MGLKDRIIPVPGLLHQCRSRCRDRSERSNNPGARTITPEVPLPLPGPSERSNNHHAGTITPEVPLPLPGLEPKAEFHG